MPTAKPPGAPRRRADRPANARNVWARTQLLVEVLLEVMEREMKLSDEERSEQWL